MADGLNISNVVRAHIPQPFADRIPMDAEEAMYLMEGAEPFVQSFNGAQEQKGAPNYTDYLLWRERGRPAPYAAPYRLPEALEILREIYQEGNNR